MPAPTATTSTALTRLSARITVPSTTTVPAAVLEALAPGTIAHCRVGHCSAEPGHRRLLERLGQRPLLDLGMRLGEASGAAVAIQLVRAALACHAGMATFADAGVSRER